MKSQAHKIDPAKFILSVLTPKQRFEAGMRIAREAFRNTELTMEDIEAAVQRVRRIRKVQHERRKAD